MAPPIITRACTVMHSQEGWVTCIWIVYTRQGSVEVMQVTGSLLLQIILCCLIVAYVCLCLSFEGKQMCCDSLLPGSLRRLVHSEGSIPCTVTVYITSGAMVSGKARGGRPRNDRSAVSFHNELQISWNAPESFLTLDSPEVVIWDTSVVSRPRRAGFESVLRHACGSDRGDRSDSLNGRDEQPATPVAHISVDGNDGRTTAD